MRLLEVALLAGLFAPLAVVACGSDDSSGDATDGGGGSGSDATTGHPTGAEGGAGSDATSNADGSTGADGGASGDGAITDAGFDGNAVTPGLSKVGTGEYETLMLVDGVIYGYGGGSNLLGEGTYQGISIPARAIDLDAGTKFSDVQGGLHQSMALDVNGHVWTWGESDMGLQGSGNDAGIGDGSVPYMITTDDEGNPFGDVIGIEPTGAFDSALKSDGTVWVWGNCAGGVLGDGTAGGIVAAPTRVPIPLPAGVKITKISGSSQVLALASDGSVWTWGPSENNYLGTSSMVTTDSYTPHQVVSLPTNIVDVTVGFASFQYALTSDGVLYGWGYRGGYLGLGDDAGSGVYLPTAKPVSLQAALGLPLPVKVVATDYMTTHVILTDGSLWGWGDDAQGEVGDGRENDFSKTNPPYAWDYGSFELPVWKPVRILPAVSSFTKVFANSPFDFYDYAQTADGQLYSWGRNKTGTLGNGVYPLTASGNLGASSDMAATYPNSWDQPMPTLVTPLTVKPMGVNSPYCVAHPTATDC